MRQELAVLTGVLVLLSGCSGHYLWRNAAGEEMISADPCGNAVDPCNASQQVVRVTKEPPGEEFWEFKVETNPGSTYPRSEDRYIIGSRDKCEAARDLASRGPGHVRVHECKGPRYFHRG
jgi:hypothetical protein